MIALNDLVFVDDQSKAGNWFYQQYFARGSNARYFTFQLALNLLRQRHENPLIIETGCQRQKDDLGAGMSTSIFAEYIEKFGGKLITVDNNPEHLSRAKEYITQWPEVECEFVESDSVKFLREYNGSCNLLYLDSYDYPIDDNETEERCAQEHNFDEFLAIHKRLTSNTILLLDDNLLPRGGKPKLLKEYLRKSGRWTCLLDYQQSLWVQEI